MKTRVLRCENRFYPQYKGWVFWHYCRDCEGGEIYYLRYENAVEFAENYYKIVWENK